MLHEQIRTSVIDDESIPWIPFTPFDENVQLKVFRVDAVRGEVIVLLKAPARAKLPRHHHSGRVIVYTTQGRWKYAEHDWIAGPGSLVYEPAASRHTPQVVAGADGEAEVVTLNIISGDLLFMDEHDRVLAIENWKTMLQRYLDYCARSGIVPRDLSPFH